MNIGRALKEIRKSKNITQFELSEMTGLSVTTIGNIESNKTVPTNKSMKKISSALDTPNNLIMLLAIDRNDIKESRLSVFDALFESMKRLILNN